MSANGSSMRSSSSSSSSSTSQVQYLLLGSCLVWSAAAVTDAWIKFVQHPFRICLKGLLIDTSRGCSFEVQPPGMMQSVVSCSFIMFVMLSVVCALKLSSMRRALWSGKPNLSAVSSTDGCQMCWRYSFIRSSSIQALVCTHTRTPSGAVSFRRRFPLKMTMGGSIEPSAAIVSTTVMCRFSTPVLRITQDFTPTRSIVFPGTRSKYTGVSGGIFQSFCNLCMISSCLQVQQEASVKVMFSLLVWSHCTE